MGLSITDCDVRCNTVGDGAGITMREPSHPMDKQTLGARIVRIRRGLEIKQDELAERLGFTTASRLGNYESGRSFPAVPELKRLAAALGLTVDQLLADDEGAVPTPVAVPGVVPGHVSIAPYVAFSRDAGLNAAFLPESVLRRRLPQVDPTNIKWLPNPTTAMSPTIAQGAMLLIDTTHRSIDQIMDGETYLVRVWEGRPDIRRIFITGPNEYRLAGGTDHGNRIDLTGDDYKSLEIGGKVIDAI